MNEPAEPTIIATAEPEEEVFSAEEHVEHLFEAFNKASSRPPSGTNETVATNEETGQVEQQVESPSPSAPAAPPSDNWEKRYNDLQSDMDRRVNNGVAQLRQELNAQLGTIISAIKGGGQPQQPETFSEAANDETKLQAYFDRLVDAKVAERLNGDPRVQAGGMLLESSRFQEEHADWKNYSALIEPALKWFLKPAGTQKERMDQIYGFAKEVYSQAAEQAKAAGEAVRANTGKPTTPQPQTVRVTGSQQQALRERANSYATERGVSAVTATKPSIDPYDPRKLRQNLEALISEQLK